MNGARLAWIIGSLSQSSISASRDSDNAGDFLHRRERAPQVRHIRHLEAEAHAGNIVAALRAHRGDVDALARERLADIPQQALTVRSRYQDIHRVRGGG